MRRRGIFPREMNRSSLIYSQSAPSALARTHTATGLNYFHWKTSSKECVFPNKYPSNFHCINGRFPQNQGAYENLANKYVGVFQCLPCIGYFLPNFFGVSTCTAHIPHPPSPSLRGLSRLEILPMRELQIRNQLLTFNKRKTQRQSDRNVKCCPSF